MDEKIKQEFLDAIALLEKKQTEWNMLARRRIREIVTELEGYVEDIIILDKSAQSALYKKIDFYNIDRHRLYTLLKNNGIIYRYDNDKNLVITKPSTGGIWENIYGIQQ